MPHGSLPHKLELCWAPHPHRFFSTTLTYLFAPIREASKQASKLFIQVKCGVSTMPTLKFVGLGRANSERFLHPGIGNPRSTNRKRGSTDNRTLFCPVHQSQAQCNHLGLWGMWGKQTEAFFLGSTPHSTSDHRSMDGNVSVATTGTIIV